MANETRSCRFLYGTVAAFKPQQSMQELGSLSFFSTKKNPAASGELKRWMYPRANAFFMYTFTAWVSGTEIDVLEYMDKSFLAEGWMYKPWSVWMKFKSFLFAEHLYEVLIGIWTLFLHFLFVWHDKERIFIVVWGFHMVNSPSFHVGSCVWDCEGIFWLLYVVLFSCWISLDPGYHQVHG